VQLENKAGHFVSPNAEAFAAAAANANWTETPNFAVDLTDMPGAASWPIVSATFVLLPKATAKTAAYATTVKLFAWAFAHGDDAARALQYVPLPEPVKAQIEKTWTQ
jgi:phosphate transport system substrate-binding protein